MTTTETESNVARQREFYGEPVGDLVRRVSRALSLSQLELARVLGLSPAMLSQLVTGHRIKIGNPLALARLQLVLDLAGQAPGMTQSEVAARLDDISRTQGSLTTRQFERSGPPAHEVVRGVLHAVASGQEIERVAGMIEEESPAIADLLRRYGNGSPAEARAHYESIRHVLG